MENHKKDASVILDYELQKTINKVSNFSVVIDNFLEKNNTLLSKSAVKTISKGRNEICDALFQMNKALDTLKTVDISVETLYEDALTVITSPENNFDSLVLQRENVMGLDGAFYFTLGEFESKYKITLPNLENETEFDEFVALILQKFTGLEF